MLSTPRLTLRPFTLADAPKLFAMFDELVEQDQFTARTRLLRAAFLFTHRGIASSLDADERAAGLPPVNTADGYVAPDVPDFTAAP